MLCPRSTAPSSHRPAAKPPLAAVGLSHQLAPAPVNSLAALVACRRARNRSILWPIAPPNSAVLRHLQSALSPLAPQAEPRARSRAPVQTERHEAASVDPST